MKEVDNDLCNKIKYSKKEAQRELNFINNLKFSHGEKKAKGRLEKRIYECNICNAWHLTAMTKEEYERSIIWHSMDIEKEKPIFEKRWNYLLNCISPYKKET